MAISDLVRDIKNNASNFVNDKKLVKGKFQWQEGYGVFSYSQSQIMQVYDYILNQEEHHRSKSFQDEYIELLKLSQIDYEEKYLWEVRRTFSAGNSGLFVLGFYPRLIYDALPAQKTINLERKDF